MRKLFVAADIEGCAGVASQNALSPTAWEWPKAREWMTSEVNAVSNAALAAGYDEIIVADGHGNAQNIIPDMLPAKVRLVRSWPRPLLQMTGAEDPAVEACVFLGNHASASSASGVLAHTYHGGAVRDLRLNGVSASEGYFNAALAGALGKPVALVTGDDVATEDARRYAPDAELCAVKQSLGWRSQSSLTPAEANEQISRATTRALSRISKMQPFVIEPPFIVDLVLTTQVACEVLNYLPFTERLDATTIRTTHATMQEAMKFVAFAIFYSPTGNAPF